MVVMYINWVYSFFYKIRWASYDILYAYVGLVGRTSCYEGNSGQGSRLEPIFPYGTSLRLPFQALMKLIKTAVWIRVRKNVSSKFLVGQRLSGVGRSCRENEVSTAILEHGLDLYYTGSDTRPK